MTVDDATWARVRPAAVSEYSQLEDLVVGALAVWGYGRVRREEGRGSIGTVPPGRTRTVRAIDRRGTVAGFYALDVHGGCGEIALFFVARAAQGTGLGRLMWRDLTRIAASSGVRHLTVDSEPGADEFYQRMGMVRSTEIECGDRNLVRLLLVR
jgi:GNAT superfamily N-acetyltransferase